MCAITSSHVSFHTAHYSVSLNFFVFLIVLDLKVGEHESVSKLITRIMPDDNHNTATVSGEIKIHLNYVLSAFSE